MLKPKMFVGYLRLRVDLNVCARKVVISFPIKKWIVVVKFTKREDKHVLREKDARKGLVYIKFRR
jgi:hypothetical protein